MRESQLVGCPILRRLRVALPFLIGLSACNPGDADPVSPDPPDDTPPPLSVRVTLDDVGLATQLGWQAGVPSAAVRVHKTSDPYDPTYWSTATTDSGGLAEFQDLLEGQYDVEVTRELTKTEAAQAESDVRVVAGGRWLNVPRDGVQQVTAKASRDGGLVISELALAVPLPWETGGGYHAAKYIELYNNSDEVKFLDRMILGFGWEFYRDLDSWTCGISEPFRTDPQGIWSRSYLRFPGEGSDYPVGPGETVLVARSAVDHTSVHSSLSDLTSAEFEFPSAGSAGNPDVPDLTDVGSRQLLGPEPNVTYPIFLAAPTDTESLPTATEPLRGVVYHRFPISSVVDVAVMQWDYTKGGTTQPPFCSQVVTPDLEALPGPALWSSSDGAAWTGQRRLLGVEGGRGILQDTNSSMSDFVRAWKTPGQPSGSNQ